MSKFNRAGMAVAGTVQRVVEHPTATTNLAGGLAYDLAVQTRLYTRVCTSMVNEAKYYQGGPSCDEALITDLRTAAAQDPEWVLKLAAYARNEMYLRSVSTLILAEAAGIAACRPYVRQWAPCILKRADELQEVLAYRINKYGRPIPACLRRGVADAMHNFDEYQLAKYDTARKGGSVTMQDVLRLCHVKPRDSAESALYRHFVRRDDVDYSLLPKIQAQLAFNTLNADTDWDKAMPLIEAGQVTWEVALSKFGNKKAVWDALDLPFMAGLRNLRNLIQSGADLTPVLDLLQDHAAVKWSKQLPFRFYAAAAALDHAAMGGARRGKVAGEEKPLDPYAVRAVKRALETALDLALANIPKLPGRTCVLVDVSGSMTSRVSSQSQVTCLDIATLFGAACGVAMDALVCAFTDEFKFVDVDGLPILKGQESIKRACRPSATYPHLPILQLIEQRTKVDRFVLLSDMQCYSNVAASGWAAVANDEFATAFTQYKTQVNPAVKLISIDLAGYGTAVLPEDDPNVALLAGWSDRLFDFIRVFEAGEVDPASLVENYSYARHGRKVDENV